MTAADELFRTLLRLADAGERLTYPAIMVASGYTSKATVHFHLRTLRDAGRIDFDDGKYGTIRLITSPVRSVPLLRTVAT